MAKKIRLKFKTKVESKVGKEPIKPQLSGDAGVITTTLQTAVEIVKKKKKENKDEKPKES